MKRLQNDFLCTLGVLLTVYACRAQGLELRIMSFNVQQPNGTGWDSRKVLAAAIINNEQPDIIGTQEAMNDQRDYLIANCPGYRCYGLGRDPGDSGEGSRIFWKEAAFTIDSGSSGNFWLSTTPDSPSRFGGSYNRICTYVRLVEKATGQGFSVFNIHNYLPNESDYRMQSARMLAERMAGRAHGEEPVFGNPEGYPSAHSGKTRFVTATSASGRLLIETEPAV